MKQITKIIIVMITLTFFSTNYAFARDSYAARGALIGAIPGAIITGGTFAFMAPMDNPSRKVESAVIGGFIGLGIGAAGGAILGGLIGLAIPKHDNISIAPTFNPTPGSVGGGINFAAKF